MLAFPGLGFITEFGKPMLANGVLNFPKHHKLLERLMINLSNDYKPNFWGYNGPLLFIRTIKEYCKLFNIYEPLMLDEIRINQHQIRKNSTSVSGSQRSCDINVYPERFFYPFSWQNYMPLYAKNSILIVNNFIQTYSVHFYGKFSSQMPVKSGDNSLYEFFASTNCPITYSVSKLNNLEF